MAILDPKFTQLSSVLCWLHRTISKKPVTIQGIYERCSVSALRSLEDTLSGEDVLTEDGRKRVVSFGEKVLELCEKLDKSREKVVVVSRSRPGTLKKVLVKNADQDLQSIALELMEIVDLGLNDIQDFSSPISKLVGENLAVIARDSLFKAGFMSLYFGLESLKNRLFSFNSDIKDVRQIVQQIFGDGQIDVTDFKDVLKMMIQDNRETITKSQQELLVLGYTTSGLQVTIQQLTEKQQEQIANIDNRRVEVMCSLGESDEELQLIALRDRDGLEKLRKEQAKIVEEKLKLEDKKLETQLNEALQRRQHLLAKKSHKRRDLETLQEETKDLEGILASNKSGEDYRKMMDEFKDKLQDGVNCLQSMAKDYKQMSAIRKRLDNIFEKLEACTKEERIIEEQKIATDLAIALVLVADVKKKLEYSKKVMEGLSLAKQELLLFKKLLTAGCGFDTTR